MSNPHIIDPLHVYVLRNPFKWLVGARSKVVIRMDSYEHINVQRVNNVSISVLMHQQYWEYSKMHDLAYIVNNMHRKRMMKYARY